MSEDKKTWTFLEHREQTAKDCEAVAEMLKNLSAKIRDEGNMEEYERFWISDGTEEGDARIDQIAEHMCLRFLWRKENLV